MRVDENPIQGFKRVEAEVLGLRSHPCLGIPVLKLPAIQMHEGTPYMILMRLCIVNHRGGNGRTMYLSCQDLQVQLVINMHVSW